MSRVALIASSYAILAFLVLVSLEHKLFQDLLPYFLLLGVLFLIRDSIYFFGIPKNAQHQTIAWKQISTDRRAGKISWIDRLIIINRALFFPILLIAYISLLLVKQLDILSIGDMLSRSSWVEYSLLGGVALSGFLTVFRESIDIPYQITLKSYGRTRSFVFLSIFLSLLGTFFVFRQTASLGLLSIPISTISGLLIFLIGIMLLEEGDEEEEPLPREESISSEMPLGKDTNKKPII